MQDTEEKQLAQTHSSSQGCFTRLVENWGWTRYSSSLSHFVSPLTACSSATVTGCENKVFAGMHRNPEMEQDQQPGDAQQEQGGQGDLCPHAKEALLGA